MSGAAASNGRQKSLEAAYRLLLRLYPLSFRREFGDSMVWFFRSKALCADRCGTHSARIRFLFFMFRDVLGSALPERWTGIMRFWRKALDEPAAQIGLETQHFQIIGRGVLKQPGPCLVFSLDGADTGCRSGNRREHRVHPRNVQVGRKGAGIGLAVV